jgi:hypothetical protein
MHHNIQKEHHSMLHKTTAVEDQQGGSICSDNLSMSLPGSVQPTAHFFSVFDLPKTADDLLHT